ncbi:MAG: glycosyltransferase [Candidatus Hydrogenedentes bacterium]|nr:glycosyltransferase [Candidatus Hydrogenedentota bacterium]
MAEQSPEISVVVPIYNEEATIPELYRRLTAALEAFGRSYEIIAIDDGSKDRSVHLLREYHAQDPRFRVVRLMRNYGQSPALYAGFSRTRGQYVVMIDADLQNFPEDIPKLIEKLEEGYDMVSGFRKDRKDGLMRHLFSRSINYVINRITRQPLSDYGCALKAFRRELVDHLGTFTHRCRYLPVDAAWVGGAVAEVEVRHAERTQGESKYGILKLVQTAFDLLTGITVAPLQFIGLSGFGFAAIGFAMSLRVAYVRLVHGDVHQLESIIAIFFFLAGMQMVATGLMCEYIGRLYVEVQRKPYYIIRDELE